MHVCIGLNCAVCGYNNLSWGGIGCITLNAFHSFWFLERVCQVGQNRSSASIGFYVDVPSLNEVQRPLKKAYLCPTVFQRISPKLSDQCAFLWWISNCPFSCTCLNHLCGQFITRGCYSIRFILIVGWSRWWANFCHLAPKWTGWSFCYDDESSDRLSSASLLDAPIVCGDLNRGDQLYSFVMLFWFVFFVSTSSPF